MPDEFYSQFQWMTPLLEQPIPEEFPAGSTEYRVLALLKEGWGRRDTIELLTELSARFGEAAGQAVERFLELHVVRDWSATGAEQAREGSEVEDFVRLLWEPVIGPGLEFTTTRGDGVIAFCVSRCPTHDLAERTGMHTWLYHLCCSTDFHSPRAFSPKIRFSRTKTLMRGDECCNHRYEDSSKVPDPAAEAAGGEAEAARRA